MPRLPLAFVLILLLGLLVRCSSPASDSNRETAAAEAPGAAGSPPRAADAVSSEAYKATDPDDAASEPAAPVTGQKAGQELSSPAASEPPPAARKLIYHAEARVKVSALPSASLALDSLVHAHNAYVSNSDETHADGERRRQTAVRVPPARFEAFLRAVGKLGTVEQQTMRTDDITARHADLSARLVARRALEQEYLRLLKQGKKISDLLEVEEKLGEVREEIEATESQLKGMDDLVAYSTVVVTLYQPVTLATPDAPVTSLGARLLGAVYTGWEVLLALVVGLLTLWPLWLFGGAVWLMLRRSRTTQIDHSQSPPPTI